MFPEVHHSSRYFFDAVGKAGDCAMGSAVSSEFADCLIDISDTYLHLIDNVNKEVVNRFNYFTGSVNWFLSSIVCSQMPGLRKEMVELISQKLELLIKKTPVTLKEHNNMIKIKTDVGFLQKDVFFA